jgi:integrase/recombinase XerD
MNRSQFYRIFSAAAERAGLPADKRHPHVLKHSLAVALVEANVNLATVRVALGHKSIASTAIYAMPSDESAGRAVIAALVSL